VTTPRTRQPTRRPGRWPALRCSSSSKAEYHTEPVGSATFADGRIAVSGAGEYATDENGYPVAWFDPAKEVALSFATIGGQQETVSGLLPVYHNVLVGGDQYRFAVTEGPSDFAIVTVERCDYP
jgi:hypothetical protein